MAPDLAWSRFGSGRGDYGVKRRPTASVPVIAVTRDEAAHALGVSLSHFQRHIAPDLRTIRSGSVRLYPVRELELWADRSASLLDSGYHQ
jgi:hypothetical protein